MRLICVGTGSSGNSYILTDGTEMLILDAGVRFMEVKKALDFRVRGIEGVIVTHSHGDHTKYIGEYWQAGIRVHRPYETESLRQDARFGGFTVKSFGVVHDVPCCGFLISHKAIGKMLYVTDAEYVPYRFSGLNVMLIEANYSDEFVDKGAAKYRHVLTGHMALGTTLDCIRANASEALNHVVLCHLSDENADPDVFLAKAKQVVPAGCTVDIARPGMTVDLGEIPF